MMIRRNPPRRMCGIRLTAGLTLGLFRAHRAVRDLPVWPALKETLDPPERRDPLGRKAIRALRDLLVIRRVLSGLRVPPDPRDRLGLTGPLDPRGRRAQPALSLARRAIRALLV